LGGGHTIDKKTVAVKRISQRRGVQVNAGSKQKKKTGPGNWGLQEQKDRKTMNDKLAKLARPAKISLLEPVERNGDEGAKTVGKKGELNYPSRSSRHGQGWVKTWKDRRYGTTMGSNLQTVEPGGGGLKATPEKTTKVTLGERIKRLDRKNTI